MKMMKKSILTLLVLTMALALVLTGCGKEEAKLEASDITGSQVQEEFWNTDLDASAEYLNGYRAQTLDEVTKNWRQAKMQGNGAILYALYSSDLKETYLYSIKRDYAIWNFYYGREDQKPIDVQCSTPMPIEDIDNMYYSTVTTIESDGMTVTGYDIYIELVDGGYFVTSETAPEIIQN